MQTKPIVTLAEWDNASTEQRAAWLRDGHTLTADDAERLRLRQSSPRIVAECINCNQPIPQRQNTETPYLERASAHLRYGHTVRPVRESKGE